MAPTVGQVGPPSRLRDGGRESRGPAPVSRECHPPLARSSAIVRKEESIKGMKEPMRPSILGIATTSRVNVGSIYKQLTRTRTNGSAACLKSQRYNSDRVKTTTEKAQTRRLLSHKVPGCSTVHRGRGERFNLVAGMSVSGFAVSLVEIRLFSQSLSATLRRQSPSL